MHKQYLLLLLGALFILNKAQQLPVHGSIRLTLDTEKSLILPHEPFFEQKARAFSQLCGKQYTYEYTPLIGVQMRALAGKIIPNRLKRITHVPLLILCDKKKGDYLYFEKKGFTFELHQNIPSISAEKTISDVAVLQLNYPLGNSHKKQVSIAIIEMWKRLNQQHIIDRGLASEKEFQSPPPFRSSRGSRQNSVFRPLLPDKTSPKRPKAEKSPRIVSYLASSVFDRSSDEDGYSTEEIDYEDEY